MPKPSSQAEIINVLKSNQEKEDDDGKEDVLADVSEQELGGVQLVHVLVHVHVHVKRGGGGGGRGCFGRCFGAAARQRLVCSKVFSTFPRFS